MMDAQYIAAQSAAIHADNRQKGFWDNPRTPRIIQGLIASEMIEAFEGIRRHRGAGELSIKTLNSWLTNRENWTEIDKNLFKNGYERWVKDTPEAELAGTCIRCFDSIGGWLHVGGGHIQDNAERLDLRSISEYAAIKIDNSLELAASIDDSTENNRELLAEYIVGMIPCALGIQTGGEVLGYITPLASVVDTLKNMCLLATWFSIDLKTHIALEVAYNRTRPMRHGNKAF